MLLIDVDLFKSYNDTYGHVRGDSCLKQIAEAALDVVARPGDLVARFGGEEFAVILPNTGSEGALQVANGYLRRPAPPQAGAQHQSTRVHDHLSGLRRRGALFGAARD